MTGLKKFSLVLAFAAVTLAMSVSAATPKKSETVDQWRIGENIDTPESTYYDAKSGVLYVSNVAGLATARDGKGWISKVTFSPKTKKAQITKWVTGLDAPKGMGIYSGSLFVTNIGEVLEIDLATGETKNIFTVGGAEFLNDITIDKSGTVYVSDMLKNRIHTIKDGEIKLFAEGGAFLEGPNGLWIDGDKLYVTAWGEISDPSTFGVLSPGCLYMLDVKTKKRTNITKEPLGNLDGMVRLPNGTFIVSDWVASKVYKITPQGAVTQLSVAPGKNSADLGLDVAGKRLFIPWMGDSKVSAVDIANQF